MADFFFLDSLGEFDFEFFHLIEKTQLVLCELVLKVVHVDNVLSLNAEHPSEVLIAQIKGKFRLFDGFSHLNIENVECFLVCFESEKFFDLRVIDDFQ